MKEINELLQENGNLPIVIETSEGSYDFIFSEWGPVYLECEIEDTETKINAVVLLRN